MTKIEYYVDGEPVRIPSDMVVRAAANLAMMVLDRTGPSMILERESGASLNQQSGIGDACVPGERFKLVPAPPDDREEASSTAGPVFWQMGRTSLPRRCLQAERQVVTLLRCVRHVTQRAL